ncbi:unnamed protein product [Miscanthus lutarioriparius]|uniref:Protein FAR1-RELATED SEQUENCE n=1 Tax=Miscanthus lutarioriparius TaxID=422564 RepID=A0A811Q2R0_9POAL|nr:unnamed protein product [Miscanthus lutarioriparius]
MEVEEPLPTSKNPRRARRRDLNALLEKLKNFCSLQCQNANFFNVIDLDDEGCTRNVFWADARSRAMCEYYSDVITLDTSYVASKYDICLATFIGVNHHGQSVLMGCALLSDETAETYSWLLKAWIACMYGNLPKAIVTDYCRGIQSAVAEVIPGVRHRMCLFQIMRKAAECLGGLSEYRAINKAMHKAVGLQGNDWLRSLYECRSSWVPVFIKDTFWAGMSATQRNETITPFFDGYVDLKTTLKQFLGKYEMALQSKYEKEAQADFETFHKQRPPYQNSIWKSSSQRSAFSLKMAPAVMQVPPNLKGRGRKGIVPTGYIGVPANIQQFVGNQAAFQPSIVYMVPSGVDPHAFGNVLMPVMYQQMFQVPPKPNETVQDISANGKSKRPRGQKLTETSQQANGTPASASG